MFTEYVVAIWSDMVARMSGIASLIFTGLSVYSPVFSGTTGASYARYFFAFVAVSCFLYANFRVWCDEHLKVVSGSPGFSLVIEQMHYEFSPANANTAFIFAVGILNRGAPSITRGWKGVFEINGVSEPMNPINISGQWVIRVGNQSVTLHPRGPNNRKDI